MPKTTIIHQSADKLFKQAMSYLPIARKFLEIYLPKTLIDVVDLSTLHLHKNSFIDERLQASAADVLYSANISGRRGYIYTLLENQGLNHLWMPYRLAHYQLQATDDHLKRHPNETRLPIVYPILLYTGEKRWTSPLTLAELYAPYEDLANLYSKPYQLVELNQFSEAELKRRGVVGLIEFALLCRKYRNDIERFCTNFVLWLFELWDQFEPSFQKTMMYYLLGGIPGLHEQQARIFLKNTLRQLPPKFRGEVMTIADYLDQQGFKRGMQQGRDQGIHEGMQKGMLQGMQQRDLEIARQMLHKGFDRTLIQELIHLSNDELEELIEEN